MTGILQPTPVDLDNLGPDFLPGDPDGSAWSAEQERGAAEKAEKEEQEKYDADARRRAAAQERIKREREEAEIGGELSGEAQAFHDLTLKPRLTEASAYQPKQRVPVVQNLLNRNTLTWVAGPSGTFKSFVTADLAFRYGSEDMTYHGRRMTHGRALVIIAEGEDGYAHRRVAWEAQYKREVKNVVFYPGALQLGNIERDMAALLHHLREEEEAGQGYGMILVDTQAMCTVGIDENSSEMNRVINVMHRLRQVSGACVIAVHHFGKDERKGMRGSSMQYAAADTIIILKRKPDSMEVTLSTSQADEGKQKDLPTEADLLTLEMRFHVTGTDYFGDDVTSLAAAQADSEDAREEEERAPDLTGRQFYYASELMAYQEWGTSPSDFAKDANGPDGNLPADGHRVTRQSVRKVIVQELEPKGIVQQVKGDRTKWRVTPLGARAVERRLKEDRELSGEGPENKINIRVRGRVREPYGTELPNPSENDCEPYSDQGEP